MNGAQVDLITSSRSGTMLTKICQIILAGTEIERTFMTTETYDKLESAAPTNEVQKQADDGYLEQKQHGYPEARSKWVRRYHREASCSEQRSQPL